jgi:hypothetical protein
VHSNPFSRGHCASPQALVALRIDLPHWPNAQQSSTATTATLKDFQAATGAQLACIHAQAHCIHTLSNFIPPRKHSLTLSGGPAAARAPDADATIKRTCTCRARVGHQGVWLRERTHPDAEPRLPPGRGGAAHGGVARSPAPASSRCTKPLFYGFLYSTMGAMADGHSTLSARVLPHAPPTRCGSTLHPSDTSTPEHAMLAREHILHNAHSYCTLHITN